MGILCFGMPQTYICFLLTKLVLYLSLVLCEAAGDRFPISMKHFINDFQNLSVPGNTSDLTLLYEENCPYNHLCTRTYPEDLDFQLSCCEKCSCHEGCYDDGMCCPDVLPLFEHPLERTCIPTRLQDYTKSNWTQSKNAFLAVDKCPKNFSDQKVKAFCEDHHPFPRSRQEMTLHLPTWANQTFFKNRCCAECHGYQNSLDLKVEFNCFQQERPRVQSFRDLLNHVTSGMCSLWFTFPQNSNREFCSWGTITYCNQTGKMAVVDPKMAAMCDSFTSIFDDVYRNVFCYLCNEPGVVSSCDGEHTDPTIPLVVNDFSAILDLTDLFNMDKPQEKQTTDGQCTGANEFYDEFQDKCVTQFCTDGAILVNNTCVSMFSSERETTFDLFLRLEIETIGSNASTNTSLWRGITESLKDKIVAVGIKSYCCFIHIVWDSGVGFYSHIRFAVDEVNSLDFIKKALKIVNYSESKKNESSDIKYYVTRHVITLDQLAEMYRHVILGSMMLIYEEIVNFSMTCFEPVRIINIEHLAVCPIVEIDLKLIDFYNSSVACISAIDFCLTEDLFINTSYSIQVCAENYRNKVDSIKLQTMLQKRDICPQIPIHHPKIIFTLIIYCLSALCLLVTIIVYSMLPSLLTLPGKNIVCLCISLLIGLTMFTFGAGQNDIGRWCFVLGLLSHYFMLSAVCWMNVCSVHMFSVFATNRITIAQNQHAFLKNCLYCQLVPMFFVISNVVASYLIWGTNGYGTHCECFISPVIMKLTTFVAPVFIIALINLILYIKTIVQLHRVKALSPRKEQTKKNSSEFSIYIKLSTLTGITWIWGLINALLRVEAIGYIFVAFNLGQGVFIFFCFVSPKNVWRALCQRKERARSRPSQSLRLVSSSI